MCTTLNMGMFRLGVNTLCIDSKGIHGDGCVCTREVCIPNGKANRCSA